jgi:methylenetetrahydrofolate dehydrogenase (NAD+)
MLTISSDAVGRPLAVMLANDGARVLSVDINTTLIVQRLPGMQGHIASSYPEEPSLGFLIEQSDAVISAVPGKNFKVPTASLHQGTVCIDLSEHGNFEDDVRARAGVFAPRLGSVTILMLKMNALILRSRAMAEVANTNA